MELVSLLGVSDVDPTTTTAPPSVVSVTAGVVVPSVVALAKDVGVVPDTSVVVSVPEVVEFSVEDSGPAEP